MDETERTKLHPTQKRILKLSKKIDLNKLSFRAIGSLVGVKHAQSVSHHIDQLTKRGLLEHKVTDKTERTDELDKTRVTADSVGKLIEESIAELKQAIHDIHDPECTALTEDEVCDCKVVPKLLALVDKAIEQARREGVEQAMGEVVAELRAVEQHPKMLGWLYRKLSLNDAIVRLVKINKRPAR